MPKTFVDFWLLLPLGLVYCCTLGLLDFCTLGFWTLGLWYWWTLGLLDFGTFWLFDFGILDLAFFDNSESQRHFLTIENAQSNLWTSTFASRCVAVYLHRFALHCSVLLCIALLCIHCIAFFDNLECPGNFVTTKNAKTFSTIKNAEGDFWETKNAKHKFLTIKSAKAIFGILRFRSGSQALEAQGTQSGGPRNPAGPVPWGTRGRDIPDRTTHYFGTQ